jgi:hypothetical protein
MMLAVVCTVLGAVLTLYGAIAAKRKPKPVIENEGDSEIPTVLGDEV